MLSEKEKKVNLLEISNELTNYETLNQFLYFYTPKERGKISSLFALIRYYSSRNVAPL